MVSETDTRYFDQEFTGESVELTPPDSRGGLMDSIREEDLDEEPYFPGVSRPKKVYCRGDFQNISLFQFSYQGTSVMGGHSLLSVNSH